MSEAVQVALITASASVAVALLATLAAALPVLARISRRVKEVQEHVANDHKNPDGSPINLRDDIDGKHTENRGLMLAIQRDVAWIMRRLTEHDDRIEAVEDTIQTKGKNP